MSEDGRSSSPSLEVDRDRIAWITFDDPDRSLNVLTEPVLRRLDEILLQLGPRSAAGEVAAVVIRSGKPDSFIAGADVHAIAAIEDPREGQDAARAGQYIFGRLERLPVPTVSAIHGICLGGAVEMSLACRYRVASDSAKTKLGLPEVQLGILPCWGGTTRLPRLIGLQAALDLLLTGKNISARQALKRGLVDAVVPAELFQEKVHEFTQARIARAAPTGARRGFWKRVLEDTAPGRALVLRAARRRVLQQTGGHYPAPLRILDVVSHSGSRTIEAGLHREAEAAGELFVSRVSKNLTHVFFLREAARRGTGVEGAITARTVDHLGILGAGVMGGGVAQLAAYNGIRVRVKDIRHEAVGGALQHARDLFQKLVERRKLTRRESEQKMELISGGLTYDGFARADLVVEAVVERMDIKRAVLAEVEREVPSHCVLTSNTSSLSVSQIAEALVRPEQFAGMHFFNPVHRMPLVEVIRGRATADEAVATVYALALRMGKVPVVVGDGAGFLVNRILGPYLNEAGWLLGDGAAIEAVDGVARRFGMPMGPLRLIDEVGHDIARHAGATLFEAFGERMTPSPVLTALGATKRLGRKGEVGFYLYENGKQTEIDATVYDDLVGAIPAQRQAIAPEEIEIRLLLSMINEAARVMEDGIVRSAGAVDLGMIMGTGFPPFRGGLLRYADTLHPRTVLARLEELRTRLGPRFEPAELIRTLAEEDREFYQAFPG